LRSIEQKQKYGVIIGGFIIAQSLSSASIKRFSFIVP